MNKTQGVKKTNLDAEFKKRKWLIKVDGLEDAYDLAQVIKHLMVDTKETYYQTREGRSIRTQCQAGRQRSMQDLFFAAKSYIPEITFRQVDEAFAKVQNSHFSHHFCSTVRKEVHTPRNVGGYTANELRKALGPLNVKNPNYVKPKV